MIFLYFRFSAWTVSFLRRLKGKEEETDHESTKTDSADTRT